MNIIEGEIKDIFEEEELNIIQIKSQQELFTVLMLDFSSLENAKIGSKVELLFKENEVFIAKNESLTSVENVFKAKIKALKKGKILWQIFLQGSQNISSIITAKKGQNLDLKMGDEVFYLIKANDITLKMA